jgi:hypothetical protein
MRTIIAISGVVLVVLGALLGRELVEDTPSPETSLPATAPPRTASIAPRTLPSTLDSPVQPRPQEPNAALLAALNGTVPGEQQRSLVIAELEKSGNGEPQFREQGNAFGANLVAAGLASDFRCFAAGCYVIAKPYSAGGEPRIVRARDELAPNALLAITGGAPDKLVVLINNKEGS